MRISRIVASGVTAAVLAVAGVTGAATDAGALSCQQLEANYTRAIDAGDSNLARGYAYLHSGDTVSAGYYFNLAETWYLVASNIQLC